MRSVQWLVEDETVKTIEQWSRLMNVPPGEVIRALVLHLKGNFLEPTGIAELQAVLRNADPGHSPPSSTEATETFLRTETSRE